MPLKPSDAILSAKGVSKRFKGLRALNDVSLEVQRSSITALIGPNGAGKTTLFNILSGFIRPDHGSVTFEGLSLDRLPPHRRARIGLMRTFQIPRVFGRLTVLENMLLADPNQPGERFFGCFYLRGAMRRREREERDEAMELLSLLNIDRLANDYAGTLSGGQRKLVELGRVLMIRPTMIMLDEPMAGVNPALGLRLLERVEYLRRERGLTFLFVEHDMEVVMRVSDRVVVLDEGTLIADGSARAIRTNERVIDAYLGRSKNSAAVVRR
jgi:ABC-type branched-subunit amino acid transport system ATPase component